MVGSDVRLNDGPDIKLFTLVVFLSVAWPTGAHLLVFVCSLQCFSGLLDTPEISRCRLQHVSVESTSLLYHSIYL